MELLGLWIAAAAHVQILQRRRSQIFHDALVFLELYGVEQPGDEADGDGDHQPHVGFGEILRVVLTGHVEVALHGTDRDSPTIQKQLECGATKTTYHFVIEVLVEEFATVFVHQYVVGLREFAKHIDRTGFLVLIGVVRLRQLSIGL